jgi:adenine-specific DNA-methyltransferase
MHRKRGKSRNGQPAGKPRRPTAASQRKASPRGAPAVYQHTEERLLLRPDVGLQPQFRPKKPPRTYRYHPSLDPALSWDIAADRERAEALIARIEKATDIADARAVAAELRRLSAPFLQWTGKAERQTLELPTLPLFVHERLSTQAILTSVRSHKRDRQLNLSLYADEELDLADRILKAYEHESPWVNRLILGDSLIVMNSLLGYEGLGGQVQMIYTDPPYGVSFGSNFQPFLRRQGRSPRDVRHGDDADMTREPEMVQAYRDTWELGLHSYLTYLRDRLLLCRELLAPSGSIFVQINDDHVHHVREVMDEVFGADCFVVTIVVKKKGSQKSSLVDPVNDYLLWYGRTPRDEGRLRFHPLFERMELDGETLAEFRWVELADGRQFPISALPDPDGTPRDYRLNPRQIFRDHPGARLFRPWPITNGGTRANQMDPITLGDSTFVPPHGRCWSHTTRTPDGSTPGMERLKRAGRLVASGRSLDFKRYLEDFPYRTLSNWWDGLGGAPNPIYVVQTNAEIVQRCVLMTTNPGDLVLDPTCGSGTTAYVSERWGRRWITIDTSRVPLALARQRLLTATFPWFQLLEPQRGPRGGFRYERRQNAHGEEIGGRVPQVTSSTLAADIPAPEKVLVDRPEIESGVVRVTGPFVVEATIPTAIDADAPPAVAEPASAYGTAERMIEVLRRSPTLRLPGGQAVTLANIRRPARALSIDAEADMVADLAEGAAGQKSLDVRDGRPVAIAFGPEHGPVSEQMVYASS